MDEKRDREHAAGDAGLIHKSAQLGPQEVTEAELKAINKYAMVPLSADEVFTFSAVLCDNELDRQHEFFTDKALKQLQKLFIGKPVIKDHIARADNQVARIYATEIVETGESTEAGDPYLQLKAKCYMVKTESNRDLIAEIKAGIKKEGSVGFRATAAICNICGTDNTKQYCPHWPGRSYVKDGVATVCVFKLEGAKDAYEFSLVAVPAQRAAGVSKSYMGETVCAPEEGAEETPGTDDTERGKLLELRARMAGINTTH